MDEVELVNRNLQVSGKATISSEVLLNMNDSLSQSYSLAVVTQ